MKRFIVLGLVAGALLVPAEARAVEAEIELDVAADAGSSYLKGCRTVDVAVVSRSILGFVVYKFHQVKKWCWDFPRITSRSVWTYVSHVDANMDYKGVVGALGYYYTWCCGSSSSGHYSFRQGKFENCIVWISCIRSEYPWVKIWTHSNGTWSYARGL
jgi:hypothetical protein